MKQRTNQTMAYFVLIGTAIFSSLYIAYLFRAIEGTHPGWFIFGLLAFKTSVEILASFYGFAFLFGSIFYLLKNETSRKAPELTSHPPVGIVYLCCDDLDTEALDSLTKLRYGGAGYLIIHDDSKSASSRLDVDRAAERLRSQTGWEVMVLRRPSRKGGKAGALNYLLEQTGHLYEYLLLCDNDSTVYDSLTIDKALSYFQDENVAIVQCRTVAVDSPGYSPVNRLLARSINAFHVFFSVQSKYGWQPFIGHNAILRTQAIKEVGGFTPGFFSDDLDLTVRLNLKGHHVVYAPEISIGEKHPPSYPSFRKRSYKWAYGCMQTLRAHARSVLTSRRFSLAEKLSFFQFAGFYVGQTILLFYLAVTFLIVPLCLYVYPMSLTASLISGTLIIALIYLPTAVYFVKERKLNDCFGTLVACGLVYGATDFSCARGVWDCLRNRDKEWIPTNSVSSENRDMGLVAEACYGTLLLSIPALSFPQLLFLPCSFLFAGKFLFGPAMSIVYDDHATRITRKWKLSRVPIGMVFVLMIVLLSFYRPSHAQHASTAGHRIEIRGKDLYVDGGKFQVKGVHYGPWRPGTGPNKGYPYPGPNEIEQDFRLIDKLNTNTILVFDPPEYVLDLAEQHGFMVLYCFSVNWWTIGSDGYATERQNIIDQVKKFRHKPAMLGWVLGNEIPTDILTQRGDEPIRNGLKDLTYAVKSADLDHPITHSSWPPVKNLDLSFLDFTSFNLYPLWPPEVVALGYGTYIKEVLQPIAGSKPLLISEYGANTIEAKEDGQARLMKQSWQELQEAGAIGGIAFEFADQWWKNYDNPRRAGEWWDRVPAPNDEKNDDLDPEEHYGLVTADRHPKPAFAVIAQLYAAPSRPQESAIPLFIVFLLVLSAFIAWFWARRHTLSKPPSPPHEAFSQPIHSQLEEYGD
jgi:GT2 family glycosyltransferase